MPAPRYFVGDGSVFREVDVHTREVANGGVIWQPYWFASFDVAAISPDEARELLGVEPETLPTS